MLDDVFQHCNIFFFNDTATTEIDTLALHDALPILTLSPSCAPLDVALATDAELFDDHK